jgi:hypothetical protein
MAKGSFDGPVRATTLDANDQLKSAEDYRKLTIAWRTARRSASATWPRPSRAPRTPASPPGPTQARR